MNNIISLQKKCLEMDVEYLKAALMQFVPNDLQTIEEHKVFIEVVAELRKKAIKAIESFGKNSNKTITSLLSVGEDGIYSNPLRYLFELIQNVDDCEYVDTSNCLLDIKFDIKDNTIELTYNETGFKPINVIGITGIGEEIKNTTNDKIEIGEKGMGFKSVFGIADSVLIQSGKFSFEIYGDNFTLPVPRYNNFVEQKGTRLLLRLKSKTAKDISYEIVKTYTNRKAILAENPVLFLNKLTKVKFYSVNSMSKNISMCFEVTPKLSKDKLAKEKGLVFEDDIQISIAIEGSSCNDRKVTIKCYRYTMPITYNRDACCSRYSDETSLDDRKHNLIAVIPHIDEISDNNIKKGKLYSFLPTQMELNMPILLHAPYKLVGSREYVDSQNQNLWFRYTNEKLDDFIKKVYLHLTRMVTEKIISYIPEIKDYYFSSENVKVNCLKIDQFTGKTLLEQKLFYSTSGTFENCNNVVSFSEKESIEDPIRLISYLMPSKKLFVPFKKVNMESYGVTHIPNAYRLIFHKAIENHKITHEALEILTRKEGFNFDEALSPLLGINLTEEQISSVCKFDKVYNAFNKYTVSRINKNTPISINILTQLQPLGNNEMQTLSDIGLNNKKLIAYLERIKGNFVVSKSIPKEAYFICENTLILSAQEPMLSFAEFAHRFDEKDISASIRIRQVSETLDYETDDGTISDKDYLSRLCINRKIVFDAFDKRYGSLIEIINKSASDDKKFISELLQNADDCYYENTNKLPSFKCEFDGVVMRISYNEDGFKKANVRAITGIGESTKKKMHLNETHTVTGEKGVGFKSVFTIASEVEIHSGEFHFKLTNKKPTVPQVIKGEDKPGTKMSFKLNKAMSNDFFTEEDALSLCLCLRRLRTITLNKFNVIIDDIDSNRHVTISGNRYNFKKVLYRFVVTNKKAIEERKDSHRIIDHKQEMFFYIPINKAAKEIMKEYRLYSGLPTDIKLNIPLIVDAPFEVTTSREGVVVSGLWNQVIREEVYNGLISLLHDLKRENQNEVFDYINEKGVFDNPWLNIDDNWLKNRISKEQLIPLINGDFAATRETECWLYLDICLYLFRNEMVAIPERAVVSIQKHWNTLIYLGCNKLDLGDLMQIVTEAVGKGYMSDKGFNAKLYPCLKANAQKIYENINYRSVLSGLTIIPAMPKNGKESIYISCRENIYTSTDKYSSDDYYILDERMLNYSDFFEIFRKRLPEMNENTKKLLDIQKYKDKVFGWIHSCDNKKTVAELLLNEFNHNRQMMDACKNDLIIDWIEKIPFKFSNGEYYTGNKFINTELDDFFGVIVNSLCVAKEYNGFGDFLNCASIFDLQYEQIDCVVDNLTADDIEDFIDRAFVHKDDIIQKFINDNKVSGDLIEKYQLGIQDKRDEEDNDYEFPTRPVENMQKLKKHILELELNRITERAKTTKEKTELPYNKKKYVKDVYECRNENGIGIGRYFCQMCLKTHNSLLIEVNAIEYEPRYAWNQMQLCLCVKCSRIFEDLRGNTNKNIDIRKKFEAALLDADLDYSEPIEVEIGAWCLYFTATHLAEIQEIIKRQNNIC